MRIGSNGLFRPRERGSALVFFAFFILFLMGAAALAIDLGMLYVARNEAQRSADAAALAGANVFTGSCALTASCESPGAQSTAAQNAVAAARANYIAGEPGTVNCDTSTAYSPTSCPGIQFTDPTSTGTEPQITVAVQRTGISLIFARMFGVRTGRVSAKATAEAYLGAGIESSVTPFLLPNCDPSLADAAAASAGDINTNCYDPSGTGQQYAYFINNGKVVSPDMYKGLLATDPPGAIGEPWTLHYAYQGFTTNASGSVSPSQWSLVSFPNSSGTFSNSNSNVVSEIESGLGPGVSIGCGAVLQTVTGNRPETIDKAVNTLIDASNDGPTNAGQDYLTNVVNAPNNPLPYPTSWYINPGTGQAEPGIFSVTPGSATNLSSAATFGTNMPGTSHSIILAPLFNANTLSPGNQTVQIDGFAVIFLDYSAFAKGQETIQANIINLIPCSGSGNNNGNNGTVSADASPIPIRLIQHPN